MHRIPKKKEDKNDKAQHGVNVSKVADLLLSK